MDIFNALIEYHPKKNTKIVQFICSLWLYLAVLLARWGGGGCLAEEGGHAAAVDWVQTLAGTSPGETHGYMGQTQTLGGHISKSQARSLSQTWVRSCQYVTDITGRSMLWCLLTALSIYVAPLGPTEPIQPRASSHLNWSNYNQSFATRDLFGLVMVWCWGMAMSPAWKFVYVLSCVSSAWALDSMGSRLMMALGLSML